VSLPTLLGTNFLRSINWVSSKIIDEMLGLLKMYVLVWWLQRVFIDAVTMPMD